MLRKQKTEVTNISHVISCLFYSLSMNIPGFQFLTLRAHRRTLISRNKALFRDTVLVSV